MFGDYIRKQNMKTNRSFKIFKFSTLVALGIAITAAWTTQPVFGVPEGVPDHQLVLTENSSTSLTVTFDGSTSGITVAFISTDVWTVTVTFTVGSRGVQWTEPENSSLVNQLLSNGTTRFAVFSDSDPNSQFPTFANGAGAPFGTFSGDGGAIIATFNDNGDVATVPDSGSTLSLLGFASLGLVALRRKLRC